MAPKAALWRRATYERCRAALEELGLRASPALEEARAASTATTAAPRAGTTPPERLPRVRSAGLVSVLFAELAGPMGARPGLGPEDVRELVGGALAGGRRRGGALRRDGHLGLGGRPGGVVRCPRVPRGRPRAGAPGRLPRRLGAWRWRRGLSLRAGVETGQAVVGPIGAGAGPVRGAWARWWGRRRPAVGGPAGSVLVGPATRAATEGLFEWGPTEDVVTSRGPSPSQASYLERPKARPAGQAGRRRLAGAAPLVGRQAELSVLHEPCGRPPRARAA